MTRRSRKEIDSLVITSAQSLFLDRGFKSTSTREIAEQAGVAEPLIFRRHKTKSRLFVQAVVVPLQEDFNQFDKEWKPPANIDANDSAYLTALYSVLKNNCRSLLAITTAIIYERKEAEQVGISDVAADIIKNLIRLTKVRINTTNDQQQDMLARILVSSLWSAAVNGTYFVSDRKKKEFISSLVEIINSNL